MKSCTIKYLIMLFCAVWIGSLSCLWAETAAPSDDPSLFPIENKAENVDPDLFKTFTEYWRSRAAGQLQRSYALEAPHTRYQVPFKKYTSRYKRARKLNRVVLLNVDKVAEDLVIVRVQSILKKKKTTGLNDYVMHETWVKLRGIWYHVIKDRLLDLY